MLLKQAFADSIDLKTISDLEFGRVPYVLILLKLAQQWREEVRVFLLSVLFLQKFDIFGALFPLKKHSMEACPLASRTGRSF